MLSAALLTLLAYLSGSISSAILICRMLGVPDPRGDGSGNPGATNVLRLHGKLPAALTLGGDVLKGLLPLLLGHALGVSDPVLAAMAVAAFLGHLYPVFFGFQGGKGVATYIGVLLGLAWPLGAGFIAVWLFMALVFRYSSLAALTAAAVSPGLAWIVGAGTPIVAAALAMVALLFWRHRSNIRKLLTGAESKIGAKHFRG